MIRYEPAFVYKHNATTGLCTQGFRDNWALYTRFWRISFLGNVTKQTFWETTSLNVDCKVLSSSDGMLDFSTFSVQPTILAHEPKMQFFIMYVRISHNCCIITRLLRDANIRCELTHVIFLHLFLTMTRLLKDAQMWF